MSFGSRNFLLHFPVTWSQPGQVYETGRVICCTLQRCLGFAFEENSVFPLILCSTSISADVTTSGGYSTVPFLDMRKTGENLKR